MTWAARRRLLIIFIIFIIVGGIAFWRYSPSLFKAPMCTDGLQNGTETGIDCGGTMCTNLCTADVRIPTILWSRAFPVTENIFNVAAYVENKNNGAARHIPYEFRIYDKEGILLARRGGVALVPPSGRYVIVETAIDIGNGVAGQTVFEFSKNSVAWDRVPEDVARLRLATSATTLDTTSAIPKLSTTLKNPSPTLSVSNTVVAAVVYDADDNAVNVSRTIVPMLAPGASTQLVFTWPRAFSVPIVRYEIVPIIDVFSVK